MAVARGWSWQISLTAVLLALPTGVRSEELAAENARLALATFLAAWNSADNDALRATMHFPFVTLAGGGRIRIAREPGDFASDFAALRKGEGWRRSEFHYDTYRVHRSSADKVHCEIVYSRTNDEGERYRRGKMLYVVTRRNGRWGLQMRSPLAGGDLSTEARGEALAGAQQAVREYFTAFNAADGDAASARLHYPHVFLLRDGNLAVADDRDGPAARPDFESMRARQNWHVSTIDSLAPIHVAADMVQFELVFSRWHPDGTRYWTVPALWVLSRVDGRWGIQLRSLMLPTFDEMPTQL